MIKNVGIYRAIGVLFAIAIGVPTARADTDPVYRSKSESGRSNIYTSRPKSMGDKPVDLPPIMRVDKEGRAVVRQVCKTHGGINCAAGRDRRDGSVICYDGYTDSEERFNFNCTAPKLEIVNISHSDSPGSFTVLVRNLASADARDVRVKFSPEIGGEYTLSGDAVIKGYQSGEYTYKPLDEFHKFSTAERSAIRLSCSNCP